jgi:hypothetical protein
MSDATRKLDYEVGYGKTPRSSRFQKGRSGNPKGRPKGRQNQPPYESVLGQIVSIKEGGVERRVTAAAAFLLYMTKRGLDGDGPTGRLAMAAIEEARSARGAQASWNILSIVRVCIQPGSVNSALQPLRMASKLDRYRPTSRMAIEPWLVEEALSRLGDRRLSLEEQIKVVRATRTPGKVRWPDWWEIRNLPLDPA